MAPDFDSQMAAMTTQLADICHLTGIAMGRATHALLHADLVVAEQVIGGNEDMAAAVADAEESDVALLASALQESASRDAMVIVGSIQIIADIDRMGALARHVAKIARRRHPKRVLPDEVTGHFSQMGAIAVDLAERARQVIVSHDLGLAHYIREADDAMDYLHRHLFTVLMERDWRHGTAAAVDVTLLGRYYERFADHAVEISRRVIFQATGHTRSEERILIPRLR